MDKKLNIVFDYVNSESKELARFNCNSFDGTFFDPNGFFEKINFKQIKKCGLDDVNDIEKFYYVINTPNNSDRLIESNRGLPLTNEIINLIKNKPNFNIIYLNESESDVPNVCEVIENEIEKLNLNPKQFFILTNNAKLYSKKVNFHNTDSLFFTQVPHLLNFDCDFLKDKKFLFMTHNRNPKPSRYALIGLLKKYGILNETDWSLIITNGFRNIDESIKLGWFSNILEFNILHDLSSQIDFLSSIEQKRSFFEEDFNIKGLESYIPPEVPVDGGQNIMTTFMCETYMNSYINLTVESNFETNNMVHITEKSYKPFYFYQLPMILATYEHTKYVKEKFKVDLFEDLIDFDYDTESDNRKRFTKYINEVKRLYTKKDDVKKFYVENKERFLNNKQIIIDGLNNKKDSDYLLKLI